jgi:hypothetical protein
MSLLYTVEPLIQKTIMKNSTKTLSRKTRRTPKADAKMEMAFSIYRSQLPLYRKVEDKELFCKLNRNPLFDITTNLKKYKTRWVSAKAVGLESDEIVWDHFVQRSMVVRIIFDKMVQNPQMKLGGFQRLVKKYCQQVCITKDEHQLINTETRGKEDYNFTLYDKLGIKFVYNTSRGRKKNFHYEMYKNYGPLLAQ